MNKRRQILLLMTILASLAAASGFFLWPAAVRVMPAGVKARLPEPILALAETPLPTALPTAARSSAGAPATIVVPTLPPPTVTPMPTATTTTPVTMAPTGTAGPRATQPPPTPTTTRTPRPTATARPPTAVHLNGLEVIPQKFNNCGPANLTVVLDFYDYSVDQLAVGDLLKPNYDDRNVSPEELAGYVDDETPLQAAVYRGGDLALLKRLLAAGYPVIVEKGLVPSEWEGWMGHYLTLIGYDDVEQHFIALDTFLGPWDSSGRLESYEGLAERWSHFNNTFVLIYPPEAAGEVAEILGPDFQEPARMWQRAAQQAQAETEAQPDNAYAWFNLGTGLTQLAGLTGDTSLYAGAAVAFDRAREIGLPWRMLWYRFEPYVAYLADGRFDEVLALTGAILTSAGGQNVEETYLYRGHALLAQGDAEAAAAAYRRALSLNPNLKAAEEALAGFD